MIVTSPKTEHHPGKGTRVVPLFPELREILLDVFEAAPDGAVFVVDPKYRRAANKVTGWGNANLRTTFLKIIRRAGMVPWDKPFQNLRASRETELLESYPIKTVTAWLGNSPKVALKHYAMVTPEHWARATESQTPGSVKNPARNPAQQQQEMGRTVQRQENEGSCKSSICGDLRDTAEPCGDSSCLSLAGTGLEPVTSRL